MWRNHFIAASWLLLVALPAFGSTYYVSPGGSDRYSGRLPERPFSSINRAIRNSAPGDTIFIMSGTYREIIEIDGRHGKPEHPICLIGLSTAEQEYPIIDGGAAQPSRSDLHDWMKIDDSEWIEIARMKFINGWTFPVKVRASSYITFRDCRFWGGKRVINASGPTTHHLLVENCYWDQGGDVLWHMIQDSTGVPAWTSMHHGLTSYFNGSLIDFSGTGGSMVIRRNTIVNAFQAIRFRGRRDFDSNVEIYENHVSNMRDNDFEPEYFAYNLHIYHNSSHNVHKTLSVDNVEGGLICYYGNTVTADTDSWTRTITAGVWKVYGTTRTLRFPLYAFNNSFVTSGIAFHTMHGKAMHLKHFNNAYYFRGEPAWDLQEWDESDAFDYDIANRQWPPALIQHGQERHGTIADVRFIDAGKGNLLLMKDSPAIDAGIVMRVPEFDWVQSYSGKRPEMGAYEDGERVDGPPFRFLTPPGATVVYKERPRIVRYRLERRSLLLYFSSAIDPRSFGQDDVEVFQGEDRRKIDSVAFPNSRYEMAINLEHVSDAQGDLSIRFRRFPRGMNGQLSTSWASTIRILH